ncbi:Retrovirus-related Pol polyprotein from type-1 retrotransposable element R2 [Frankliniella fusca]|uniref:Retrovirus-related Pol polyprotein from type-1 retrotransposable element R2 n=1 Tax=Frankliniella fusca TaxID=407009 RepID=A0AAE1H9D6_9NEOP|nr:Retrovirus-related Pol polyprotein from type-1 retrotransposable element R2 [Frankliniella fusca]
MGTLFVEVPLGRSFLCPPPCPLLKPGKPPHKYKDLKALRKHARAHHNTTHVLYVCRVCAEQFEESHRCDNKAKDHLELTHGLPWVRDDLQETHCAWHREGIPGLSPPPSPGIPQLEQAAPEGQATKFTPMLNGSPPALSQAIGHLPLHPSPSPACSSPPWDPLARHGPGADAEAIGSGFPTMTPSGRVADPDDPVWAMNTSAGQHPRQVQSTPTCPQQLPPLSPPGVSPAGPVIRTPLSATASGSRLHRAGVAWRKRTPPALRRTPLLRLQPPRGSPPDIIASPVTPRSTTPLGRPWQEVLAEAMCHFTAPVAVPWSSPRDPMARHDPGAVAEAIGARVPPTTLSGRGAALVAPVPAMLHSADAAPRQVDPGSHTISGVRRSSLPLSSPPGSDSATGCSAVDSTPPTPDGFGVLTATSPDDASSSLPRPNRLQQQWVEKLLHAKEWADFESIVADYTSSIAPPPKERGPQHRGPRRPRKNVSEAQRIQQLYMRSRKDAMREIRGEDSPVCESEPDYVAHHFDSVFMKRLTELGPTPDSAVLPPKQHENDSLCSKIDKETILARLKHCSNTAPGPDGITYAVLRSKDPGAHVLYEIFERCRSDKKIPTAWKLARTILLHKKGDRTNLDNWRPISLSSVLYKVYTGILATRLGRWAAATGAVSPCQKGFMPAEGCLEHNFLLQQCLDAAKEGSELVCTWLDLRNAFGSVPHVAIFHLLELHGVHQTLIDIIKDLYADYDLALVAKTPKCMQEILNVVGELATWIGLQFNGAKCATLHVKTRKARSDVLTTIQGQQIPSLHHGEAYQHLGVPTGLYVEQTPEDTFQKMLEDLHNVERSLLKPWQKLDAIRTFILPQAQFILLTANLKKKTLDEFDRHCKRVVKSTMNLPRRASPEVVFIPMHRGGANIPPLSELADVGSIVRAFKMLTCPDPTVREIAAASLQHNASPVLDQKNPSNSELCTYLTGSATPKYSRAATIWSAARSAARRLATKLPGLTWSWSEAKSWSLNIPSPGDVVTHTIKQQNPGSGGIRTHASEETGALNQRLRPLGHATR